MITDQIALNVNMSFQQDHNVDVFNETKFGPPGPSMTFEQVFWTIAFSSMLSFAIFGNIIVIWVVIAHRRMRTVTNFFLVNLSVADCFLASLNGTPNFIYMLKNNWIFGTVLCVVNNFVANFTVSSCVFTMTAISIDRYLAIIRPLQPRMTKSIAWKAIGGIWLLSAILSLPNLLYSSTITYDDYLGNSQTHCLLVFPDGDPTTSTIDFAYNLCLLVLTYIIPMILMGFCYGCMSLELWGHRQIGEVTQRQQNSMASKKKVVRMFICLVVSFCVLWLPYHGYFLYVHFDSSIVYKEWVRGLYLSFYWLAMSTSMINPILYYFLNTKFRVVIQELMLKCLLCGRNRHSRHFQPETPPLFRRYSRSCSRSGTDNEVNLIPKKRNNNHQSTHLYHYQAGRGRNHQLQNGDQPGTSFGQNNRFTQATRNNIYDLRNHHLNNHSKNNNGLDPIQNTYC